MWVQYVAKKKIFTNPDIHFFFGRYLLTLCFVGLVWCVLSPGLVFDSV
jgi:hypothetical protein